MHPNHDEIAKAKALLLEAGYLCLHISPDAEWTTDVTEIAGPAIAVQVRGLDLRVAEQHMMTIKRAYNPETP